MLQSPSTLKPFQAPVMIFYRSSEDNEAAPSQNHHHEGYEIYYLYNGYRSMSVAGREFLLRPGDLLLLPPGVAHQSWPVEGMPQHHVVINLGSTYLDSYLAQNHMRELEELLSGGERLLRLSSNQQYQLDMQLHALQQELTGQKVGADYAVQAHVCLLLLFLLRSLENEITTHSAGTHRRRSDMQQVASFIEEHYADPISLAGIAKIFATNASALSRSFRRYMGVPPIHYLNRVRVQAAKALIENTDMSLTEVCSKVGYESLTYFGRVFREFTGVTPSQYRRQIRNRS